MAEVHEWYFGQSGVQVLLDAKHAGSSMLTLIVEKLDEVRSVLIQANLQLGPTSSSDFASIAQITDPDGNLVTFAEPGLAQRQ